MISLGKDKIFEIEYFEKVILHQIFYIQVT